MPSWKKVITSGSNAVLNHITSSGDFKISGNISGSSTSTGSFGHGYIDNKLGINTTTPQSALEVFKTDNFAPISFHDGYYGYSFGGGYMPSDVNPNSNGLSFYMSSTKLHNYLTHGSGQWTWLNGSGTRMNLDNNGNLELPTGNISGSSTSTASFGRIQATTIGGNSPLTIESPTLSGDTDIDGNLTVIGDITAQNFIVSSSVTYMTQSFSSGSTIFGDSTDDTHQFTGSLKIGGNAFFREIGSGHSVYIDSDAGGVSQIGTNSYTPLSIRANGNQAIYISQGAQVTINNLIGTAAYMGSLHATSNVTADGNISGSSTSTGSFGLITNPGGHYVHQRFDENINYATFHNHKFGGKTRIRGGQLDVVGNDGTTTGFISSHLNKVTLGVFDEVLTFAGANGSNLFAQMTGSYTISGSATGTGSFGAGYIDNKLGIGTTSPTQPLDVYGHVNIANTSGDVQFFFNTSNQSIILGSKTFIRNLNNTFEYGNTSGLTAHKFFTDGTQRVTIDNSGNVGIGTANPGYPLEVYSAGSSIQARVVRGNGAGLTISAGGSTGAFGTTTNHDLELITNFDSYSANNVVLITSGSVSGSSTSTGSFGKLLGDGSQLTGISGASFSDGTATLISGSSTSTGSFGTIRSVGKPLFVDSDNVGIGTTSPAVKTHIYTTGAGLKVEAAGTSPYTQTIAEFRYLGNGNNITIQNIGGAASLNSSGTMQIASAGTMRLSIDATNSTFSNNIVTSGNVSGSAASTGSFGKVTIGGPVFNDVSSSRHSVLTIHSPSGNQATGSAITIVGDSVSGRQRINWDMDGDDKVYSYIEARGQGGGDNRGELYFGTRNGGRESFEAVPRLGINSSGRVSIMGTFGQTESQVAGGDMMFNSASLNVFTGNTFDNAPYAGWFENRVDATGRGGIYISTVTGRDTNAIIRAAKRTLAGAETKVFEVLANGQISGSASSTGSFGAISVKNGGSPQIFGNSNGIGINNASDIDHPLDVQGVLRVSDAIHGFHDTTNRIYQRKWIQFGPNVEHHASATDRDITFFNDQTTNNPVLKVGGGSGYTSRVGINQRTPSATLDVVGNVEISSHITGSGNLEITGNISGSSTSTGSFGHLFIAKNDSFANVQANGSLRFRRTDANYEVARFQSAGLTYTDITIGNGTNFSSIRQRGSTLALTDGKLLIGYQSGYEVTSGHALEVQGGKVKIHSDLIVTGSIEATTGNISGSSTSTGSFGSLVVDNAVQGDLEIKGNLFINDGGLDLDAGQLITGQKTVNAGTAFTFLKMYDPGDASIQLGSKHSLGYISFQVGNGAFTERMRIKNNGNIGIGTDSPSVSLEVRKTDHTVLIASSSTAGGGTLAVQSSNGTGAGVVFRSEGGHNRGRIYYDGHITLDNADDAARSVRLRTGQSTAASGKDVAVIKIAPSGSNSGYFGSHGDVLLGRNHGRADSQQTSDFAMHISSSAEHGLMTLQDGQVNVVAQDAKIKIMSERHNTGTGTTSHFTTLGYDTSGARPFILSNQSNTPILFKNNAGSIPLAIHTNQYVGVNTTSPGYRLDVLHDGDDQFRVGRSGGKYVAIRDDVMQFTGMTGNGMRIQTSDNSDIKFSAGTGDIIFDYANSGGRVISYADVTVSASLTVTGDIIAQNYIVSSSTTYMTTSFSAGSTAFGDTPADDTHQFTGSLTISGSSVNGYSGSPPTAILANPANTGSYGLHVRGINRGIRLDRYNSTNASAHTNIYQNGSDWTIFTQNISDPIGDPDADITKGIGVNRIGGNYYPQNNSIDFYSYDLKRTRLGKTQLVMDSDITFTVDYNKSFIVSGSKIEFTPTEKVSVTGNLELDGALTEASTMRIKTNIETLESPLDKISKLRGVSYNLKKNNEPSIGMIAEEVEEVFPELVSKDDSGKAAAMSYGRMTAVLLEAIKELKEEVDELKQENIYMKQMNRKNK